jgi:hypothetical protein
MSERYCLSAVRDDELMLELSALVRRGNDLTSDVLAHLAELDERGLHLDLGYPSLFAYCIEALGMSESAAGRRIAVARVCRKYPVAFERLATGDLHLSGAVLACAAAEPGKFGGAIRGLRPQESAAGGGAIGGAVSQTRRAGANPAFT